MSSPARDTMSGEVPRGPAYYVQPRLEGDAGRRVMNRERLFRGSDEVRAFDWVRAARDLDVPLDIARALYQQAIQQALDLARAEALYQRWLREVERLLDRLLVQ